MAKEPNLTWRRDPPHADLKHIGWHLRHEDARELFASNGESPVQTVIESWVASEPTERLVFYWKKEPTWVCGIVKIDDKTACPWMVATPTWETIPKKVRWELSKWFIDHWLQSYERLVNHIDARNGTSRTWLGRLGAEETELVKIGPFDTPFFKFEITKCVTP